MMRYVYMGLIALAVLILLVFKIQNLSAVTVSLFGVDFTMPVSFMVFFFYVLGMLTGGSVYGLLRSWTKGALQKPQ
jgi:lipopolysaccharide assembly protein A